MAGWTYQKLIDDGMTVTAYCHNPRCHHKSDLNLDLLAEHFGPDASAMHDDIKPKLVCAKCGGKEVGLIYSPAEAGRSGELR